MVGKVLVSAFQNFLEIENQLNNKKVISKTVKASFPLNYSKTYFELDSEEATHCHHCHLICCVYIEGLVNTKDQSKACMCEMMSKGLKEALTVLIVTHVTHVEGGRRSLNSFTHNFLNIQPIFNPQKDLDFSNHTIQCYVC